MRQSASHFGRYIALSLLIHSLCIAWALYTLRVVLDVGDMYEPVHIHIATPDLPSAPAAATKAPMLPPAELPTTAFAPETPPLPASIASPEVVAPSTTMTTQPPRIVHQRSLPDVSVLAQLPELTPTPVPQAPPRPIPAPAEPDMAPPSASTVNEAPLPVAPLAPIPPAPQQTLDQPAVPISLSPLPPPVARLVSETRSVARPPVTQAQPTETRPATPQPSALPPKISSPDTLLPPQTPPPVPAPPVTRREPPAASLARLAAPPAHKLPTATSVPTPRVLPPAERLPAPTVPTPLAPESVPPALQPPPPPAAAAVPPPDLRPPHQATVPRPQPEVVTAPPLARSSPGPSLSTQPRAAPQPSSSPGQPAAEAVPQFAYKPCPQYPYVARRRGLEGTVLLRVQMRVDGTVGEVEIVTSSGHYALDNAAIRAVKKWTYVPARHGAQAPRSVDVPMNFRLQRANGADGDGTSAGLHLNCDPS